MMYVEFISTFLMNQSINYENKEGNISLKKSYQLIHRLWK
jgi:hypothetical protein